MSENVAVVGIDAPEPAGPKWAAKDRDAWLDAFEQYSGALVGQALEETHGLKAYDEAQLHEAVRLGAELADTAVEEMQYRFHNHPHQTKAREAGDKRDRDRGRKPRAAGRGRR